MASLNATYSYLERLPHECAMEIVQFMLKGETVSVTSSRVLHEVDFSHGKPSCEDCGTPILGKVYIVGFATKRPVCGLCWCHGGGGLVHPDALKASDVRYIASAWKPNGVLFSQS